MQEWEEITSMYHTVSYNFTGFCPDVDFQYTLESGTVTIAEDLRDAIPYLYEKHFGVPYRELGWWLEPGAREWMKDIEDKWFHNQLDLSEVYKDEEYLQELAQEYYSVSVENIDDMKDEFEDALKDELENLSNEELKELYEYDDSVDYTIEDDDDHVVAFGFVYLPDLDEDEEDDE